ncbi:MAG TPA: ATP-binding protein [Acidobacteria bacterium]|nr:ATP-binding protein [Acidobacteriota bacterium]
MTPLLVSRRTRGWSVLTGFPFPAAHTIRGEQINSAVTTSILRIFTSGGVRFSHPPGGMILRNVETGTVHRARMSLSSRFENIEVAERVLVDLCDSVGCPEEDRTPLLTSLREAVANAVRHGNRLDLERRVGVEYEIDSREIVIRVTDEGEGFDPAAVPDPTAPENLLRPGGRGIFFMKQLMDRVVIEGRPTGGTLVTMTRRLQRTKAGEDLHEE